MIAVDDNGLQTRSIFMQPDVAAGEMSSSKLPHIVWRHFPFEIKGPLFDSESYLLKVICPLK